MQAKLRKAQETDVSFIFKNWLASHRYSDECKRMNNEVYYRRFKSILTKILTDSDIMICCNPEDENQNYGFICFKMIDDIPVIHYVYVKYLFRHHGLCKLMISYVTDVKKPMMCTFANTFNRYIRGKWFVSYDPYLR